MLDTRIPRPGDVPHAHCPLWSSKPPVVLSLPSTPEAEGQREATQTQLSAVTSMFPPSSWLQSHFPALMPAPGWGPEQDVPGKRVAAAESHQMFWGKPTGYSPGAQGARVGPGIRTVDSRQPGPEMQGNAA